MWPALARTVGMHLKVLREKVLQKMDARRHLYAPFVLGSYMELLNELRNPNGWTTEMGDAVVLSIATCLRRAIVVFNVRDATALS